VRTYASTPSSPTRRTPPQEGGRGITKESGSALLSVVDFLTLGNHAFDADGYEELLEREESVARPANFGEGLPGQGWDSFEVDGVERARVGLRRADTDLALRGRRLGGL
jgi:hypothetical protein